MITKFAHLDSAFIDSVKRTRVLSYNPLRFVNMNVELTPS